MADLIPILLQLLVIYTLLRDIMDEIKAYLHCES